MFRAISTVGRPTLLVRDNEIIGQCRVCYMRGDRLAGVEMIDDSAKALVIDTQAMKVFQNVKYIRPRFNPADGAYIESGFNGSEATEIDQIFQNVKIVDQQDLELGMCPDSFEGVPSYRKTFKDIEENEKEVEQVMLA